MLDMQLITVLGLGFLLGARHALDADHLAAVSTMLSVRPSLRASSVIGLSWGVGHAAVLLAVGLAVLLLKVTVPEGAARALEFAVGVMLLVLGGALAWTLVRERWHWHLHRHDGAAHLHLHSHRLRADHAHGHWLRVSLKPFAVGMVHGLAGSAAVLLVVLSAVRSPWVGVAYILAFGVGSIVGMVLLGLAISLPLVLTGSFGRSAQMAVQGLASLASLGLGLAMMIRTGLGDGLF